MIVVSCVNVLFILILYSTWGGNEPFLWTFVNTIPAENVTIRVIKTWANTSQSFGWVGIKIPTHNHGNLELLVGLRLIEGEARRGEARQDRIRTEFI